MDLLIVKIQKMPCRDCCNASENTPSPASGDIAHDPNLRQGMGNVGK
jgi:hypothetical protein